MSLSIAEALRVPDRRDSAILKIDEALKSFEKIDPRRAKVVELRFFGGMTVQETAQVLNVSPETVMRDWRLAKAWLMKELSPATVGFSDKKCI